VHDFDSYSCKGLRNYIFMIPILRWTFPKIMQFRMAELDYPKIMQFIMAELDYPKIMQFIITKSENPKIMQLF